MARRLVTALAGIPLSLAVFPASAADRAASATIRYEAPAGCPNVRDFMRRVGQRTGHARIALPDDDATVLVSVESAEDGFRARMSLRGPEGTTTREVTGADCDSVSSAMALITAIAVESSATETAAPEVPRCPHCPRCPPTPPTQPRIDPPTREPVWGLGGSVQLAGAVAPGLMMLSEHFVELAPGSSSFRLSYVHGSTDDVQDGLEARTLLNVGRVGACPLVFGVTSWSRLSACLAASVGAVRVQGEATRSNAVTRVWADATTTARWEVRIVRSVGVHAEGGAIFPAVRYSYEFRNPDAEFHQTASIAPFLAVGLKISLL